MANERSFSKVLRGYSAFRQKYASGDQSVMQYLSHHGQQPQVMVIACCDSRVDPALILQCDPGDLFVVRNVANIVPPYEKDEAHHGTSAALEFGIRVLKVKHLILLGHSQCGGIRALLNRNNEQEHDFITNWVSLIRAPSIDGPQASAENHYAKSALHQSYQHCLTFPWIAEMLAKKCLTIHRWFFDIETGKIFTYSEAVKAYEPLDENTLKKTPTVKTNSPSEKTT